jgi:hypothetical protein
MTSQESHFIFAGPFRVAVWTAGKWRVWITDERGWRPLPELEWNDALNGSQPQVFGPTIVANGGIPIPE